MQTPSEPTAAHLHYMCLNSVHHDPINTGFHTSNDPSLLPGASTQWSPPRPLTCTLTDPQLHRSLSSARKMGRCWGKKSPLRNRASLHTHTAGCSLRPTTATVLHDQPCTKLSQGMQRRGVMQQSPVKACTGPPVLVEGCEQCRWRAVELGRELPHAELVGAMVQAQAMAKPHLHVNPGQRALNGQDHHQLGNTGQARRSGKSVEAVLQSVWMGLTRRSGRSRS